MGAFRGAAKSGAGCDLASQMALVSTMPSSRYLRVQSLCARVLLGLHRSSAEEQRGLAVPEAYSASSASLGTRWTPQNANFQVELGVELLYAAKRMNCSHVYQDNNEDAMANHSAGLANAHRGATSCRRRDWPIRLAF